MRRKILAPIVLCLGILVCVALNPAGAADKKGKEGQVTGKVHMIAKDLSTITVVKNNVEHQVIYNSDTKWAYGTEASNKPGTLDQLKEDWYINCKGTFDGVKLVANACRFRETK